MSQADLHSDSATERLLCILGNVGSGGDSTFGPLRNEESFADHTACVRPLRLGSSEREDWKLHRECDRILPPTSAEVGCSRQRKMLSAFDPAGCSTHSIRR